MNEEVHFCDYGCGQEAKFLIKFKNSVKWCCSKNYSKCKANIKTWNKGLTKETDERILKYAKGKKGLSSWNKGLTKETDERVLKISKSKIGIKNSEEQNKKISFSLSGKKKSEEHIEKIKITKSSRKYPSRKGKLKSKINYYLKNYKDFLDLEFLDEDKETNELIVKCSVCGKKFKPKGREIYNRIKSIKDGKLNASLFLCSEECKIINNSIKIKKSRIALKRYSSLKHYKKTYPKMLKFEFLDEDKETNELIVKCSVCGKKFKPKREQISYRGEMIEVGKLDQGIFYCSKECKDKFIYEKRSDKFIYNSKVWRETNISIKKYGNKIDNLELRGKKHGFQLDHKFSLLEGFKNNIDPKNIGHWKNLEVIVSEDNTRKSGKCSITLEQLLKDIENTKD